MHRTPVSPWPADAAGARRYWESQFAAAKRFMQERRTQNSVLIEIAAQHPLTDRRRPGPEFAARLDRGAELFGQFHRDGTAVEIYVPGNVHVYHGESDDVSLSYAGTTYLRKIGIPADALHGDDLNFAYKGAAGVYNSADECFVAASFFKDNDFGRLVSVVSPAQLFRKTLYYAACGVLPLSFTAPVEAAFHDYVEEAFDYIPYVLMVDHDLQSADSRAAAETRAKRRPNGPMA